MRAAYVTATEGPSAVAVRDVPEPEPADGQLLIEVRAAGVTFPDLLLSLGQYQMKPEPPFALGTELTGVVVEARRGSGFRRGDRVAAFPMFGAFAEYAVVDAPMVFPLPDEVSFEAGAALPMNYLTCHFALTKRGRMQAGETVLVHGASGGVGTAAVQLASAWGARTIAVVSTEEKMAAARAAGAAEVILADGFLDAVRELTGGQGVDIVVDPVGGDRFTDSLRSLAPLGRLLVLGFTAGSIPEIKVNRLLLNNVDVVGVGWGAYWAPRRIGYLREQWDDLVPLLATGKLDPVLGARYSLDEVGAALTELAERRATGKLLITP